MMERNAMTADRPLGGSSGRPASPAAGRVEPGLGSSLAGRLRRGEAAAGVPLTTPLVWAWGGVLLTATTWLVGVIALFRSVGGLFD